MGIPTESVRLETALIHTAYCRRFSRLKAMLRKAGERTVSGLWGLIGSFVDIFLPAECANYFSSCGYEPE